MNYLWISHLPKFNVHPIKSIASRLKPSRSQEAKTRVIAQQLYLNRQMMNRGGNADSDWIKASRICKAPARQLLFWVNQPFVQVEKRTIEPIANWVDNADLFRIIERISPAIEALGVIAIPFVLFFAGQQYQERLRQQDTERLQQQAVKDYISQLSTILLDAEGDLRDPKNERLRTLTTATTLTLLREPNLDGDRKGQVIKFLSEMNLVNRSVVYGPYRPEDITPTLSLKGANLREADLKFAKLTDADMSSANLIGANLIGADLSSADLSSTQLRGAYLHSADLSNADLTFADLRSADLRIANLRSANLRFVDLRSANLTFADLHETFLYEEQLENALLCGTQLPEGMNLNPNRDCKMVRF